MTNTHLTWFAGFIMIVGLLIVFLLGLSFWPWLLVVVAVAGIPSAATAGRLIAGVQSAVWLSSFAGLIYWDAWWPWILLPLALSATASLIFGRLEERSRKHAANEHGGGLGSQDPDAE